MSSSYFGDSNMGNERGSGSSTRKGKKSSEKPKQPQRGLGVAQLEKIRLHGQMGSGSYHPSLHNTPPFPTNFNQEDMRVQTAYSSVPASSSFSYSTSSSSSQPSYGIHYNNMMEVGEYEGASIIYGDSQPTSTPRWNPGNSILETHHYAQPSMNRHLLNLQQEESQQKKSKKHGSDSMGSSSQNSESSDVQEVDLELRLSL